MKTAIEKKFDQFHEEHPEVYELFIRVAKQFTEENFIRGADIVMMFAARWYRSEWKVKGRTGHGVPRDVCKQYAFKAIENGDVPASTFRFRTHLKKVQ